MRMSEYECVKDYSYDDYCKYLNNKYGAVRNTYGRKGCKRPEDGLFVHHIREDMVASLSNNKVRKENDPVLQEPQNLVYCDYLEHLLLHIKIGELTAGTKNLGLNGTFIYIIPALQSFFTYGRRNPKWNRKYYDAIEDSEDVFNKLLDSYNRLVEDIDIVIDFNQTLYAQVEDCLENKGKALVVLGTGLGKTTTALQYIWKHKCKALVIGPNNLIKSSWNRYGAWVHTTTYASFANAYSRIDYSQYGLVVLDEAHHAGYDEESGRGAEVWAKGVRFLVDNHIPVIGLTATPKRTDGVNVGESIFDGCVCQGLAIEDAIEQGIVYPFSYITSIYDTEKIYDEYKGCTNKELVGQLDVALNNTPTVKDILNKYMPTDTKRKGVVFISEIEDKEEAISIMRGAYPNAEFRAIDSKMPVDEVIKNRWWFENAEEGYLVAVNMISEGAHYRGVNTLIMFRKTTSYLVYTQQIGRIITLTKNENPNAIVFDFVNNVESVEYNDRKISKKTDRTMSIAKVLEANKKAAEKSSQIIIADETRDVVKCIRKVKDFNNNTWESWEDAILTNFYKSRGADYCCALINSKHDSNGDGIKRTARTIMTHCSRICLYSKRWSDDELSILKELYPQNPEKCLEELKKINQSRNKGTMVSKANTLMLKSDRWWSQEELELIKNYYPIEGPSCFVRLYGRTKSSVMARASKLGLQAPGREWSDEEINIIKKYYANEGMGIIKRIKNRSAESISAKATSLGIYSNNESCMRNRQWTEEEDNIIREYYPAEGAACVIRLKNRSRAAVLNRAWFLGVKTPKRLIRCVENGDVGTVGELSKRYGIHHGNLCNAANNTSKTAGGYHWEYVDD